MATIHRSKTYAPCAQAAVKFGRPVRQEIRLPLKAESIGHGRCGHLEGARNYSVKLSIDYK
jgi:hypothetical protein